MPEISNFNPCIVRLDPTKIVLSALSDYYLVVYFTASDSNNGAIGATEPTFRQSSLMGWDVGSDQTHIAVGGSIPSGNGGWTALLSHVRHDQLALVDRGRFDRHKIQVQAVQPQPIHDVES